MRHGFWRFHAGGITQSFREESCRLLQRLTAACLRTLPPPPRIILTPRFLTYPVRDTSRRGQQAQVSSYNGWHRRSSLHRLRVSVFAESCIASADARVAGDPNPSFFWGTFFGNAGETDVILADTSFALEEEILKTSIPLSDYLNYGYKHLPEDGRISPDTKNALDLVLSRNNGSISDFRAARRILMLDPFSSSTQLRFARDYTPDTLKRDNVILIGSRKSNPWVDFFQDRLEFVMGFDSNLHQSGVQNLHPKPGEPQFYAEPQDPATNVGYGVVAFLPNVGPTGNALIIEGTDSQATEAAGEFVTTRRTWHC